MLAILLATPLLLPVPSVQEPSAFDRGVEVLDALLEPGSLDAGRFLEVHVSEELLRRVGAEPLGRTLEALRGALGRAEPDLAFPWDERQATFVFEDVGHVHVRFDAGLERVVDLWLEDGPGLDPARDHAGVRVGPFTWDGLAERMREQEAAGFAGAVLVLRDGEVVLDEGYGLANRQEGIPNRPDTIFAVGSTPIDFTHVGILLLEEAGALTLDQPIGDFLDDVPEPKRAITLGHLTSGASGLQDFLGRPGDSNPDHHWIDRDEAVRRILEDELLFAPGTGRAHSHAAWGLLAAVIEIVSGQSYPEFVRENVLEPAGMVDTGFFGEPIPKERMAVGYGFASHGDVNAPPYWGPTSWLVMGSGGMVSTTRDMLRFHRALAEGRILTPESARRYFANDEGVLSAGDMFGFEIRYTQGPDSLFVLVTNAGGPRDRPRVEAIARALHALVGS